MTKRFQEAVLSAIKDFESVIVDGKLDFPEFTFADAVSAFATGIERKPNGINQPTYTVSDELAELLVAKAKIDPHFFDLCIKICAENLRADSGLPLHFRFFAADNLATSKRPTPPHRERAKNWMERCFVWTVTMDINKNYELNFTRNEASDRFSASDAVAKALTSCGRRTRYTEIANLMTHADHSRLRSEFKAANRIRLWKEKSPTPANALRPAYAESMRISLEVIEAEITAALSVMRK